MQSIEGEPLGSKKIPALETGETATFAARPDQITLPGGEPWQSPLLLLTDKRFIVSKNRLLGKAKIDYEVPWTEVHRVVSESQEDLTVQLLVRSEHGEIELIVPPKNASDVNAAIRKGYLS